MTSLNTITFRIQQTVISPQNFGLRAGYQALANVKSHKHTKFQAFTLNIQKDMLSQRLNGMRKLRN